MAIIPLQFLDGQNATTLGLTGKELFTINMPVDVKAHDLIDVETDTNIKFKTTVRFDTDVEVAYFKNGGILNYMIRKMIA